MHEMSIMQDALQIALEQAGCQGAERVHRIALRVGNLSGVVPEALEFAFEVVTQGTIAEGAELVVERVPVCCECPHCESGFEPDGPDLTCSRCGRAGARVRQGRELELAYLEVS